MKKENKKAAEAKTLLSGASVNKSTSGQRASQKRASDTRKKITYKAEKLAVTGGDGNTKKRSNSADTKKSSKNVAL